MFGSSYHETEEAFRASDKMSGTWILPPAETGGDVEEEEDGPLVIAVKNKVFPKSQEGTIMPWREMYQGEQNSKSMFCLFNFFVRSL